LYAKIDTEFDSRSSVLRNYIGKDSSKVVGVRGRYQLIRNIINSTLEEGE
jgi:hypothetical protein